MSDDLRAALEAAATDLEDRAKATPLGAAYRSGSFVDRPVYDLLMLQARLLRSFLAPVLSSAPALPPEAPACFVCGRPMVCTGSMRDGTPLWECRHGDSASAERMLAGQPAKVCPGCGRSFIGEGEKCHTTVCPAPALPVAPEGPSDEQLAEWQADAEKMGAQEYPWDLLEGDASQWIEDVVPALISEVRALRAAKQGSR